MFTETKKSIQWGEETLTLETGKVARQADGFFSFCKHLCFPKRPIGLSHGGPIAADPDILFSGAGVRAPRFR